MQRAWAEVKVRSRSNRRQARVQEASKEAQQQLGAVMSDDTNAFTALMDGADATRTLPMFEEDHQASCEMQPQDLPCGQAKLEMLRYLVK